MDAEIATKDARPRTANRLDRMAAKLVVLSSVNARALALGIGLMCLGLVAFIASSLTLDTATSRLLDPDLPWRKQEIALSRWFPQTKRTIVLVVDGATPEQSVRAARQLTAALSQQTKIFQSVTYLADLPFFRKNGLLFRNTAQLTSLSDQLIASSPLLGPLAADPSMRGLFDALNQALGAVKRGVLKPAALEKPIEAIASFIEARQAGHRGVLSWSALLSGETPARRETLQVITLKPVLDYSKLSQAKNAIDAIHAAAIKLGPSQESGVTLHLTGDVAFQQDELQSVRQGMSLAALLSGIIVLGILFVALRSLKTMLAVLTTLAAGLICTLAFAAATVKALNLISVSFIVMFIGIAVDFGIQFCVRLMDEQPEAQDPRQAVQTTGLLIAQPLSLAAIATAIGFLSFVPTSYRGVSELGLIAGAGMLIALVLNFTLLPALLTLLAPQPKLLQPYLFNTTLVDRWIRRHSLRILFMTAVLALLSLTLLTRLKFDFNPLNLENPASDSLKTMELLQSAGIASPQTMQILVERRADIAPLTARLKALPTVQHVQSIESFIPSDQDRKLQIIADMAMLLEPVLEGPHPAPPPSIADMRESLADTAARLAILAPGAPPSFGRLALLLRAIPAFSDSQIQSLAQAMMLGLHDRLDALTQLLRAQPITFATIPAELKQMWIAPNGAFRIEVRPKGNPSNEELVRFADSVRAIAPQAGGGAYVIQKSGEAVWTAFQQAFTFALIGVGLLLWAVLRRLGDVVLVLGPLCLAGLFTLATTIIIGLPVNFANVIGLPLLLGIGVAFNIYFVVNWRRGATTPLRSSTARAVLFSALTTLAAFGSLATSPHPGTASMGLVLAISLLITLACAMVVLPALLALRTAPSQ